MLVDTFIATDKSKRTTDGIKLRRNCICGNHFQDVTSIGSCPPFIINAWMILPWICQLWSFLKNHWQE
jgi:hypothetical protein